MLSSVQFSCSVVSDPLQPHEPQHARPPCPSPTPRVYSNSCPVSRWCHPAISSSAFPFSSCPQSLLASGPFPMSQLFTWGGQSIGVSVQHQSFQWTPRTDLLYDGLAGSPCSPRDSQEFSPTPQFKSRQTCFITLPTEVHLVKCMIFPVVMYGCENWAIKKAEHWRIDVFLNFRMNCHSKIVWVQTDRKHY